MSITFDSGLQFSDIGGNTFAGWVELSELVSFVSDNSAVVGVAPMVRYSSLTTGTSRWCCAEMACASTSFASHSVYANLLQWLATLIGHASGAVPVSRRRLS